jgi:FAD/FMN-containing dehydrogenase
MKIANDLVQSLRERTTGELLYKSDDLNSFSTNFGGNCFARPVAVMQPSHGRDIAHALRVAYAARLPVSIRGAGHSFGRQGLCDGGLLINVVNDLESFKLDDQGFVETSASRSWKSLELELNRLGRSVPVLTSELNTTIGGTLAVGGFGEGSISNQCQAHLVKRLKLMLPNGISVWASRSENRELFSFALASLGQIGFLQTVVLRTVVYQPKTWIRIRRFRTLSELIEAMSWMADRHQGSVDFFSGQHFEGEFVATHGVRASTDTDALPPDIPASLNQGAWKLYINWHLRSLSGRRRNPWDSNSSYLWSDYVLNLSNAAEFAAFVQERVLRCSDYRRYKGRILVLAVQLPQEIGLFPFSPIGTKMNGVAVGFGLYFRIPRIDRDGWNRIRTLLRIALECCVDLGGRPYLAGWHDLDATTWSQLYAEELSRLAALRQRFDPNGLFNSGLIGTPMNGV